MTRLLSAGQPRFFRLGHNGPHTGGVVFSGIPLSCISAGERCSIAIHADGSISVWGQNADFEIGLGPIRQIEPILAFTRDEVGFHALSASTYCRRTTYLSSAGDVYLAWPEFRSSGRMGHLSLDYPAVTCVTGPNESYAIDVLGRIVEFTTSPLRTLALPSGTARSVAVGDHFAIAVSDTGVCYGLGRLTGTSEFSRVHSLAREDAKAVYAYGDLAVVVAQNGGVFECKLPAKGDLPPFSKVLFPEATTIVDASVSENGAFFVTEGRRVFAMGDNCFSRFFMEETETRGRPVEVAALRGAVRVALAPYHALAYMGPAIVQPAVNSIANFRAGDGLLQPLGFFIGDVVRFGNGLGFIVGADRRSIDVADAVELRQCEVEEVEFVTRIGFVGIDSGGTLLDGGTALYRQFGIRGGEIVGGASGLASVVGLRKGDVVMRGLTGAEIVFSGSLVGFFEQWTIVHTWRRIEPLAIGGITLPVERVDPFFARYKMRFVKVFAKIAAFWVADGGENGRSLYPQAELVKLQGENGHFEGDRVRIRGKPATVISVAKKSAVILVDGGEDCEIVPVGDLELIATLAGKERYRGVCVSALAIDDSRVLPGDLFVGKDGFVPILGWRDKRPIAVNGTRADLDGAFLVRRDLAWGNPQRTLIDSNDVICVSLMAADIAHTGFLQCDEVDIAGEKAVVVGCDDSYVWMVSADGHFFCTNETLADNDVTLVRRPTDNPSILFDCFVKSVGK